MKASQSTTVEPKIKVRWQNLQCAAHPPVVRTARFVGFRRFTPVDRFVLRGVGGTGVHFLPELSGWVLLRASGKSYVL